MAQQIFSGVHFFCVMGGSSLPLNGKASTCRSSLCAQTGRGACLSLVRDQKQGSLNHRQGKELSVGQVFSQNGLSLLAGIALFMF